MTLPKTNSSNEDLNFKDKRQFLTSKWNKNIHKSVNRLNLLVIFHWNFCNLLAKFSLRLGDAKTDVENVIYCINTRKIYDRKNCVGTRKMSSMNKLIRKWERKDQLSWSLFFSSQSLSFFLQSLFPNISFLSLFLLLTSERGHRRKHWKRTLEWNCADNAYGWALNR